MVPSKNLPPRPLHALERRRMILDLLKQESFLTVEQVQKVLGISPATTRRDFALLAEQMLAIRGHGGIHRLDDAPVMGVVPFVKRTITNPEGKERIARVAASLLKDGDIAIIDGGSTTAPMAPFLSSQVRIITNSLPLASALNAPFKGGTSQLEVNVTGGYLYPKGEVLLGPHTVAFLQDYQADWAFLGCNGINDQSVMNSNSMVVETQRAMMSRAQKVAILADHTKFNIRTMVRLCDLKDIDLLVTDQAPGPDLRHALKEHGVEVMLGT